MAGVLGVGTVGSAEDFFALGGHSLLATQLASRLRDALGVEVPLRDIFEAPTPVALASRLASCARAVTVPEIPTVDRTLPLRLSFSQERMWHLHQLDPGGSAYNVAGALFLEGPLDVGSFRKALAHVAASHETLRTRYEAVDGTPWGMLGPALALSLEVEDLSAQDDPEVAAAVQATTLAARPFDLERDDLVRARIFRLGPTRHLLAVCAHHVAVDGWSMGLLLDGVLAAYAALAAGREPSPPQAGPGYADYAAWQRDRLGAEELASETEHWRRRLEGAPLLELATDRPRSAGLSRRGGLEPVDLPAELVERLRELARAEGATLYMVMLAAFEVLLHRHTGQIDIVVGTPVANRHRAVAEKLVGTLVNTVPVRVAVDPEASFRDLLRGVRESALDAFAHQELPFERVVSALRIKRRAGEMPLFPVLFDCLNAPMPVRRAGQLTLRPLAFSRRASQFDLSLSILDTALGQMASLEYSSDLFDAATVRRLAGHYRTILDAVVADPETAVSRIPLLTPEERKDALARADTAGQAPPADVPVTLLVQGQAARTPEAVAVVDGAGALTYRELVEAIGAMASGLRGLGVGPGQRVAICLERTRAVPIAMLAVLQVGAAYVPLDPRYPAERLAFVLADAEPVVLVTEKSLAPLLPVPAGTTVFCVDAQPAGAGGAIPSSTPGLAEPAYVIYTSGSTGRPKGVEIPHRGLSNFLASMADAPGLTSRDCLLSVTTISFDIAGLEIFLPLVTGARVHLASAEEAASGAQLAALLRSSGATVMQGTPATWRLLLEAGWPGDPRLRILCGGEALPRDLAELLLERSAEVWNLYGPTETTIWSTLLRVQSGAGPVPIGFPVAHTRLYVLDRHGEINPVGVPGEIHIGGAGVATGYWRRAELTAEKFVADPLGGPGTRMYRTGDLGRFRPDGSLECLGRLDHQVKIRGHRVEPGEIEAVLREHPGVVAAAVVAQEAGPGDLRLVAYYVARESPGPSRIELREALLRRLPEYMVPAFLVHLDALPLTPNGKLDRRALPSAESGSSVTDAPRIAPRDELEATLSTLFEEVLGTRVTSVRDGFFDLGGHSLLAARLLARIERSTGVPLPPGALLEHQTVEQLAATLRSRQGAPGRDLVRPAFVVPVRPGGEQLPFFCVHGAGGNVFNLHDLGRHLPPGRPFHGLQARGVDGLGTPFASIEESAVAYLAEIREIQPHGPYLLGGYCGGGLVAYEMSQTLLAAGEQVALLVLIDAPSPVPILRASKLNRWSRTLAVESSGSLLRRAQLKWRRHLDAFQFTTSLRRHQARGGAIPHGLRDQWLTNEFMQIAARYQIRPYSGKVVLLVARDGQLADPPDAGWAELAGDGLLVERVPGDHRSLVKEPHVRALGARLASLFEEAERANAPRATA
jgi:amino acid adenylation domain-containing protein